MTRVFRYAFGLLICLLPLSPPQAKAQTEAAYLLATGDSAYNAFDNTLALEAYERAYHLDSTRFGVLLRMSRTSYDQGLDLVAEGKKDIAFSTFERSILFAQSLVRHYPDSAQAHFLLAATMGNLAIFKGGREKVWLGRLVELHSRKAIDIDPTFAYPYVSLGIYYRELSQLNWFERTLAKVFFGRLPEASFDEALEFLETALKLRPDFPFLHFELAMTFLMQDKPAQALSHLKTLINLSPETTQDARNQDYARRLLEELQEK